MFWFFRVLNSPSDIKGKSGENKTGEHFPVYSKYFFLSGDPGEKWIHINMSEQYYVCTLVGKKIHKEHNTRDRLESRGHCTSTLVVLTNKKPPYLNIFFSHKESYKMA